MIRMRYVGPDSTLSGQTALARVDTESDEHVYVQIDNLAHPLAYGWHRDRLERWEATRRRVVVRNDDGEIEQEWPEERGCGGGPNTCGGCSECMAQQAVAAGFDVTTEDEVPK